MIRNYHLLRGVIEYSSCYLCVYFPATNSTWPSPSAHGMTTVHTPSTGLGGKMASDRRSLRLVDLSRHIYSQVRPGLSKADLRCAKRRWTPACHPLRTFELKPHKNRPRHDPNAGTMNSMVEGRARP